jgi:hypothetical protein
MTAAMILKRLLVDGVELSNAGAGRINLVGERGAVEKWLPVVQANKPALLELLAQVRPENDGSRPAPCRDCARLSALEMKGKSVYGCLYFATGDYPDGWKLLPEDLSRCLWH